MILWPLSTEAFVNVYVKCQNVVTAKPRYVRRVAVVDKTGNTSVLPQFCVVVFGGGSGAPLSRHCYCGLSCLKFLSAPLVSTFDSEKKSKRLSGIQQHFKGRGAVNSVVLLLPGLWTAAQEFSSPLELILANAFVTKCTSKLLKDRRSAAVVAAATAGDGCGAAPSCVRHEELAERPIREWDLWQVTFPGNRQTYSE